MEEINEQPKQNRYIYIDIARAFAILCVVLCHAVENVYYTIEWSELSSYSKYFKIFTFTIGRIGVPIFLCISGTLLLRKNMENEDSAIRFYKKNLLPLLITTEIWNVIYYVFLCIWNGNNFNFKNLIETMLFMRSSEAPNMWYMPMILGMYLAIPFLANIVKRFSLKVISVPMLVVGIYTVLFPTISILLQDGDMASRVLDISFLGGVYGLYIMLGYYISISSKIKKVPNFILGAIVGILYLITVGIQIYLWNFGIKYNLWYNFLPLFVLGIAIFGLFKKMENIQIKGKLYQIIYTISNWSLAVFFIHTIVIYFIRDYINALGFINPVKVILLFVITLFISLIAVKIIKSIPILKKYLLLIKKEEK